MTHQALMSCDLTRLRGDWRVIIDETPNALFVSKFNIGATRSFLATQFALEPTFYGTGSPNKSYSYLKLIDPDMTLKTVQADSMYQAYLPVVQHLQKGFPLLVSLKGLGGGRKQAGGRACGCCRALLFYERNTIVKQAERKEERLAQILDDYHKGTISLTEALNGVRLVLAEIKGKL